MFGGNLVSVRVVGYKSIANDVFTLEPGFNCITGHNGAGKSNILEAIQLAFGAELPSLRASHWGDVIHKSGDANPSGHIFVELRMASSPSTTTLSVTINE